MADQPHIIDDGFSEPEQVRKIFVGNLPYEADEEMIKSHFSQFGEIIDCVVPRDPRTRFAKGFAFVTYTKGKAVDEVMSNRPHQVAGRVLEPKRAISRSESRDPAAAVSTTKLYIGSIGDLGDDHLRKYFQDFGNVAEVDTQQDKGQAFVTFVDHDSVDRCVSQKHTICGRPVEVRKALTRHQIETATKRRDSQQRRGMYSGGDRENQYGQQRGGGQGGGGGGAPPHHQGGGGGHQQNPYDRPSYRDYDRRHDPYRRDPYEDRYRNPYDHPGRSGYDSRPPYDSYPPRDRSPPRGYGYDAYRRPHDPYDRYGPPRDAFYDRYGPPESNRYAPPPPRDAYDRYPPMPRDEPKGAYPPKDSSAYAHQASVPPEARPGYGGGGGGGGGAYPPGPPEPSQSGAPPPSQSGSQSGAPPPPPHYSSYAVSR